MKTLRDLGESFKRLGGSYELVAVSSSYDKSLVALFDDSQRVPVEAFYKNCLDVNESFGDPIIGLNMTHRFMDGRDVKDLDVPGYDLVVGAHFIATALDIAGRYSQLHREDFSYEFVSGPEESKVIFKQWDDSPEHYNHVDGTMFLAFQVAKSLGGEGYTRMHLKHACPEGYRRRYEEAFGIPVLFDQSDNCFYMNNAWLASEPSGDIPKSMDSLDKLLAAEQALAKISDDKSLTEKLTYVLKLSFHTGNFSLERMAEVLNMNLRTLQRRLKDEGSTYKSFVDEARKTVAIEFMSDQTGSFSVEDAAFYTGYGEVRDFYRAFRRWMAVGPAEFRSNLLAETY